MTQATGTTADKHIPAMLISGQPLPLKYLQTLGATSGQVPTYNGTTVVWADQAVSPGEIALTSAHILVGNSSNIAADVAASGDVTLANTGAFTIANSAITTAKIAANAVDGTKIALASQAAGDVMYYDGTDWVRLAKGTAGQVLTMNAGATAPEWQTP